MSISSKKYVARPSGTSLRARCARILLLAAGPEAWIDPEVAKACRIATVENWCHRCVLEGRVRPLDGKRRAIHQPPSCSMASSRSKSSTWISGPLSAGDSAWLLRLLVRQIVVLGIVGLISHEAISRRHKSGVRGYRLQYRSVPPGTRYRVRYGDGGVLESSTRRTIHTTWWGAWTSSRCSWCARPVRP